MTALAHLILCVLFALMPACPTEDSPDCKWEASPNGHSFVDIGGTAYYLDGTPPTSRD